MDYGIDMRRRRRRRSIRVRGYNYASEGAYFITICVKDRTCLFGEIINDVMQVNDAGRIVAAMWRALPDHFAHVVVDEYVVMPNHVHGVLVFDTVGADIVRATHASPERVPVAERVPSVMPTRVGATHASPLRRCAFGPSRRSVGAVIGSFKSAVSKRINAHRGTSGTPIWQRNYYEHIIRDQESLNCIRQYIRDNPAQWAFDHENPNVGRG